MTYRERQLLWLLIGLGVVGRVVVAFVTVGVDFDIDSLQLVGRQLDDDLLHIYGTVNAGSDIGDYDLFRWPYPSGYFVWTGTAVGISNLGLAFHGVVQLLPIAADAGIAWLVQDLLGRRGASGRARLAGAALVMLGPSFFLVSGYQGQIDAVAILPAVAALWVWETTEPAKRALWAGLLLGVGGSVKTVPLLMLLALLPSVQSRREAFVLVGAAVLVPLAALAPFLIADGGEVIRALRYAGGPGSGGLTLFAQPGLAEAYITAAPIDLNAAVDVLYRHAPVFLAAGLAGLALLFARIRPPAVEAAVALWLTVYVFYPNFAIHYVVWGLPFFLIAGHLRVVALYQAALLPASLILYMRPWESDDPAIVYLPIMLAIQIAWVLALGVVLTRLVRREAGVSRQRLPAES